MQLSRTIQSVFSSQATYWQKLPRLIGYPLISCLRLMKRKLLKSFKNSVDIIEKKKVKEKETEDA